jgi:hypothetical protein
MSAERNSVAGRSDSRRWTSAATSSPSTTRATETPGAADSAGTSSLVGSAPPSLTQALRTSSKSWSSQATQKIGTTGTPRAASIERASETAVIAL